MASLLNGSGVQHKTENLSKTGSWSIKVKDASRKLCYDQCFRYYVLEKEVHEEE